MRVRVKPAWASLTPCVCTGLITVYVVFQTGGAELPAQWAVLAEVAMVDPGDRGRGASPSDRLAYLAGHYLRS